MTYGNYPDLNSIQKILVIKLRHLGDVLLSTPVFSALKKAMPHARIDAYIYKESVPILEGHPSISRIIGYDRSIKKEPLLRKLTKEFSLLRQLKEGKYDCVINLTEGDRGAIVSKYCCRTSIRVGLDSQEKGFAGKRNLYDHIIKHCNSPRHTVEKNLDAVRTIGIFPSEEDRELTFQIPPAAMTSVKRWVNDDDFILIHPSSRWKFKCTSKEVCQELIRKLLDRKEKVVITAAADEMEWVGALLQGISSENLLNLAGKTDLKELGALIQLSKVLLCVDSVSNHIASALKAPVVVFFGPTSEFLWGPWRNPNARIVSKKISCRPCLMDGCAGSKMSDCLFTLDVEEILKALDHYLM